MAGFGAVEPGWRWRIVNPWMIRTGVVHHLVLDDLYSIAVRGVDEFTQLCKRAEVFFNGVEVLRVVAVKAGTRFVFLQFDLIESIVVVIPRRQPDRRNTKIF